MIGRSNPWFTGSKPPWYRRPKPLAAVVLVIVLLVLMLLSALGSGRRAEAPAPAQVASLVTMAGGERSARAGQGCEDGSLAGCRLLVA